MLIQLLLFTVGLLLLVKGADYFVEGGSGLATRYGVSQATIGFTIIAFGTSLPEFVVSINAIASGNEGIALGNVLGSNIANIALVLAICAIIQPAVFYMSKNTRKGLIYETFFMITATVIFALLALRGVLDFISGIVLLTSFFLILWYLWRRGTSTGTDSDTKSHGNIDIAYTIGGLIAVAIGSQLLLDSAVTIAEFFGIPSFIIGMSIVAIGTSLPELATSLVAIIKGNAGISIGNILGSNIFNLLLVMGTGTLIRPVSIPAFSDILITGLFSLAAIPFLMNKNNLTRCWGALLLVAYFVYLAFLFGIL